MEELASRISGDTDKLLSKWDGRPDLIMEDIFRVRDLETKEVSELSLTDYQRKFVMAYFFGDESTLNVLKGRRTGYSFVACACLLLDAILTPHGFFAITAPSKSQAKDRIEDIYDLMDWSVLEFSPPVDNRAEIELSNHATMRAYAGNPDTSRGGDSADTLLIDEMAFLDDQEESMRAFSPFTALGDATTVELSTPNTSNDLFMENNRIGSESGKDGIISINQPAFKNVEEIDPSVSLLEQDAEPVMPYLDLEEAEKDRARDPKGFEQEYLCKPVEDQYRFFDRETVDVAIQAGDDESYDWGVTAGPSYDGKVVMGVDIAGGGGDDTAVSIVEHAGKRRYLRYHEAVTDATLQQAGITPSKARNPSALAKRITQLYKANSVDKVIIDATAIGEGFDSEIRQQIGRGVNSFNFSDREAVAEMMGNLNYGFHNGHITLVPDKTLRDQLLAIVKDKTNKGSTPSFSGKETAPNGKDDLAISFALAAYPPNMNTEDRHLHQKDDEEEMSPDSVELGDYGFESDEESDSSSVHAVQHSKSRFDDGSGRRRYSSRHSRR